MISLKKVIIAKKLSKNDVKEYSVENLNIKFNKDCYSITGMVIIKAMVDSETVVEKDNFLVYPFIYDYINAVWIRYKMNYVCYHLENFHDSTKFGDAAQFNKHFQLADVSKMLEIPFNIVEESS